ncbi:MAG: hypothetical protein K8S21_01390 [Gemmatimonadetes bacterium]|nr:hypothetical protein [Gemmatimonadota bacterium]
MKPFAALIALALALALGSAGLLSYRRAVGAEIASIDAARTAAADLTGDARLIAEIERIRFALEQARSQPAKTAEAHLALALGEGLLTLERGDIVFRTATVQAQVPRGVHLVEKVEDRLITLSGGIRLHPTTGGDSLPVAQGEIRVPRADFLAIRPNLRPGQSAYFF